MCSVMGLRQLRVSLQKEASCIVLHVLSYMYVAYVLVIVTSVKII